MAKLAEVVTLYENNSRSIVDQLRRAADEIETETDENDRTETGIFIQFTEGEQIEIYGWGKLDNRFTAAGILMAAAQKLLREPE